MEGWGFPRAGRAAPSYFPRAKPEGKFLRSSTVSPTKTPSFLNLLLRFTFSFQCVFVLTLLKCTDGSVFAFLKFYDCSVLALLKSIEGSVLAFFRLPSSFSHKNFTVREFSVPWLLCKKSNNTSFFFKNRMPFLPNKDKRLIVCIQSDRKRVF